MPIQSDDIKLLRSAVMADVPEGGGAMTGLPVVDGQSNNLFPDTSTDDRAAGRVNFRKLFGVAHTNDTDTLLGSSFVVLAPPADPLVHVTLFETPGWADTLETAREQVERYLVKGPRLGCRIMDTHYQGSLLLQLYQVGGTNFPEAGDAITVRNPSGAEQYLRVVKVTLSVGNFTTVEGSGVVSFAANVALCELGQPLQLDLLGPPIGRVVNEAQFAQVFSTSQASGVAFYGVKPLAQAAAIGDRSVRLVNGIFSPLVPAATLEEPLIDIAPLTSRASLSRTASAPLSVSASLALGPGTLLRLPTAIEPGSLTMNHGGAAFTEAGDGVLKQGATAVGLVDYAARTIVLDGGAPGYGTTTNTITYRPATVAGASVYSDAWTITAGNQGLGWVYAFEPPPAPGTLTVSYMAQGRWYELRDAGSGRLVGADNSYGTGTLNYISGSLAMTLGALPDVGSALVFQWGTAAAAVAAPVVNLPNRLRTSIELDFSPRPGTLALAWTAAAGARTATVAADGTVTGPAEVGPVVLLPGGKYGFTFAPAELPTGAVTVTFERAAGVGTFTGGAGGSYTLTGAPIAPGSLRGTAQLDTTGFLGLPAVVSLYSAGTVLFATWRDKRLDQVRAVGTVNNTTGAVSLNGSLPNVRATQVVQVTGTSTAGTPFTNDAYNIITANIPIVQASVLDWAYLGAAASGTGETVTHLPAWRMNLAASDGLDYRSNGLAFTLGGQLYASADGSLMTAWHQGTGAATLAGSVASDGGILVTALPAGLANTVSWINAAQDRTSGILVYQGVYRVQSAPIKTAGFQQQSGARVGSASETGILSGGGFTGSVDFQRGIVRWAASTPVPADTLTYNAVFLQYLPLDGALLGLETARLPLDGRVPIYRAGGQVVVHNTLTTQLPNPLVKGTAYSLGRQRVAAVEVRTISGARVSGALYTVDFNLGTITFPVPSDLTGLAQPFAVHHRIEDELMVLRADISGRLDLVAGLTHAFPAGSSYVSSKLRKGDRFARAFNYAEQNTWTGAWSDDLIGAAPTASYNSTDFPVLVTNRGAITERWAVIFTAGTQVRVVGESVGQILTSVSINTAIEAVNPATGAPYFSIPALGWGGGWAAGNVLRFNTAACGSPSWIVRTVLQGPASVASDAATIAFRSDVDA